MTKPDLRSVADEALDALLRQLPRQSQARPRPFFYGRVQARLVDAEASTARPLLPDWLRRPAFAALLGALVLSLSGDCAAGGAAATGPASYQAPHLPAR
ncbi:hypothetical protein Q5H92_09835 [Hymenobacter sp. M29]|uniref:Uncharacterized protein n=1 Tax=Hymenobacter mellowenesis TaxID=3063995 RepID=A0ABT9A9Z1_9BACT|nr:hypothetical protein [Hymenobacter sp. M29]MDO7846656.1 hypothetical protein [Hymenobacter sp. M29]